MALPLRVQSASNTSVLATVTATFGASPTQGNLLVAAVTANVGSGSVAISGWTAIGNVAVGLAGSLDLFFKIAGAGESTGVTSTATLATLMDLHVYEYSGIDSTTPLNLTTSTADSGVGVVSRASGTTAISNNASSLIFVAIATAAGNGAGTSWTNGFSTGITTADLITADMVNFTNAAVSSTASWTTSQRAAGMIATFFAIQGNGYWKGGR